MSMKTISKVFALSAALGLAPWSGVRVAYAGGIAEEAKMKGGERSAEFLLSAEVEGMVKRREALVAEKRKIAIGLLEEFLRTQPVDAQTGEIVFQLAELRWEESKANFLEKMAKYNADTEKCTEEPKDPKAKKPACPSAPPRLDLASSMGLYKRILDEFPRFRKTDMVLYLYGFALRQDGKLELGLTYFQRIIKEYPQSRFQPDAWMAVAEARFYSDGNYVTAQAAYEEVLKYPQSPLYDLALFKTAWCMWKRGNPEGAARRFKEVLDLGTNQSKVETGRLDRSTAEGQKRLQELRSEALDYLVQIFAEDERKGAKETYDFLASIGGAPYSRKVLARLGETFFRQARFDRAIEAERFLIDLDPSDPSCVDRQARVAESYQQMDDTKNAIVELRKLGDGYGPGSTWLKAQRDPDTIKHSRDLISRRLVESAKTLHADAQRIEQLQKRIDKDRYARAAEAYAFYLGKYSDDPGAGEIEYLVGDINFFKLNRNEEAGDAYLASARRKPVTKLHKEALLNAIAAYEKVRREKGKKELLPSDVKMGEAIEIYAGLYPEDTEMAGLLLKSGELFVEIGAWDEAVKRFGVIVEKYPKHPAAQTAGDRILNALNQAKDYDNVASWAKRLLKVPAFQDKANQDRLQQLVVDARMKSAEQKAEKDPAAAAAIYTSVATDYAGNSRAPQALANAALLNLRADKTDESIRLYVLLFEKYPKSVEAPKACWSAARLYDQAALWSEAAKIYQTLADKFPNDAKAPDALYNAGLLNEHLGNTKAATAAYAEYTRRFKTRDDVRQVAFRVGKVLEASGDKEGTAKAFLEFAKQYPGKAQTVEALERAAAALVALGQDKRAEDVLRDTVALYKKVQDKSVADSAAHARYMQGELLFKEFERAKLASDPKRLEKSLTEKSKLLEKSKAIFIDVVTFNDPEWATAALYRIGECYEQFAKALRAAPVPPGLKPEEQEVYRQELEKVVVTVEDKAIDAYKNGYKKALELGVYNAFTQKLRTALSRLSDVEFPPEIEVRSRAEMGAVHRELPFLDGVAQ